MILEFEQMVDGKRKNESYSVCILQNDIVYLDQKIDEIMELIDDLNDHEESCGYKEKESKGYYDNFNKETLKDNLLSGHFKGIVVEDMYDSSIKGILLYRLDKHFYTNTYGAYVWVFYVIPEYREMSFGENMIKLLEELLLSTQERSFITLKCYKDNMLGNSFYNNERGFIKEDNYILYNKKIQKD